jgi:hypothetical protein
MAKKRRTPKAPNIKPEDTKRQLEEIVGRRIDASAEQVVKFRFPLGSYASLMKRTGPLPPGGISFFLRSRAAIRQRFTMSAAYLPHSRTESGLS